MSADTKGRINVNFGVKDVQRALKQKFNITSEIKDTGSNDFYFLSFKYKDEDRDLSLFEEYTDEDTEEIGTLMTLTAWGSSVGIMTGIIEMFGGYIIKDDYEDNWEYISPNDKVNLTEEEIFEDKIYAKLNDSNLNFLEKKNIVKFVKENLDYIKGL